MSESSQEAEARGTRLEAWTGGLAGRGRGRVLAFVSLGWFLVFGSRFVFPAILPQLSAEYHLSNAGAGAVVSAIWIAYALVQFPAGFFSDRVSERSVLTLSAVVTGLSLGVIVASPTLAVFVAGSVLFGMGTGLFGPPRVIVLSTVFRERESTAIGLTFAAGSIGSAALPILAGLVAARYGWRLGFVVTLPALAVVAVGLWWALPARTPGGEAMSGSPASIVRRLYGAVTDRAVVLAWVSIAMSLFVFQGVTAFLPTYLVDAKGLSPGTAATLFGLFFVVGAACQPVAGSLADRYSPGRTLAAITAVGALPMAALTLASGLPALTALVLLLGLRQGLGPVNNGYIVAVLPDDVQGAGYGLVRTVHMAVGSTGSIFVGALADAGYFDEAFLVLAGIALFLVVVYLRLPDPADHVARAR